MVDDDGEALRLTAPRNRQWSSEKEEELGSGFKTQAPSSEATSFLHVKSPSQRFSNLPNHSTHGGVSHLNWNPGPATWNVNDTLNTDKKALARGSPQASDPIIRLQLLSGNLQLGALSEALLTCSGFSVTSLRGQDREQEQQQLILSQVSQATAAPCDSCQPITARMKCPTSSP